MSARLQIPKGATIAEQLERVLPNEPELTRYPGCRVILRRYVGYASHGYKTGYDRVPKSWVELCVVGKLRQAWGYSGKRLGVALEQYNDIAAGIGEIMLKSHQKGPSAPRVWNYYLDPRTQLCTVYDASGVAVARGVAESVARQLVERENCAAA